MKAAASKSGITVREASIESERAEILDALHRFLTSHLTAGQNEARFTWLYRSSPHGTPRVWTARDSAGSVIGVATAFPRRLWADHREEQGWVLADFCIHPDHRSLGPAVQLQRVFLEEARAGRFRFWYDFPNPGMVAVYRRLGIGPSHEAVRFAKPLRLDRRIQSVVRSRLLASALAAPGNWLLGITGAPPRDREGYEIETMSGPCGAEFTSLFRDVHEGLGLAVERSAEYLDWRFRSHPLQRHEILTARHRGALKGYAVLEVGERDGTIVELLGGDGTPVIPALLGGVLRRSWAAGFTTLSFPLPSTHRWVPLVQSLGFRARESCPVLSGGTPDGTCLAHLQGGGSWHLTYGDRES